ncbi:MAG: DUF432 domain-containing protein [Pontiellaceae bacterium]|nr:DUF432 domain-containing protein [Pontiellaceae bacterium]MBN2784510.1 DUF432 domain-containing protein [Pontiellaceae bacterium]
MKYAGLWEPIKVDRGETIIIQFGSLDLWIHRGEQEWHLASDHRANEMERLSISRDREMGDLKWMRWVISEQVDEIRLHPCMPDRPVIVRPEMPVSLLPNQSVQFYIGVPAWVVVSLGGRYKRIAEVPSMVLSNSWFGPTTEGELCYAMRTTAKLRQEDLLPHPHRVVVPFQIRNASDAPLEFTRLCLHAHNLRIYQGRERMWANQGRATYRGSNKWSRVVYARGIPPYDGADRLLGSAREPVDRGDILRTFDSWKHLADF